MRIDLFAHLQRDVSWHFTIDDNADGPLPRQQRLTISSDDKPGRQPLFNDFIDRLERKACNSTDLGRGEKLLRGHLVTKKIILSKRDYLSRPIAILKRAGPFDAPNHLPLMLSGSIQAYAVTGETRLAQAPDIQTFGDMGLAALSDSDWYKPRQAHC